MNHTIPGATKQHTLTSSLSWLTTTTWQKRRPFISKQPVSKKQKNSEQNAHYLLTIPTSGTKRASSKQPTIFKKIVSILLTICSLS